ncbi:MAG: hypothetical protein J0M08_09285 [Bacteroidetes bacterium]|nr:hypothetical protein [Bacteroidota bacterium]
MKASKIKTAVFFLLVISGISAQSVSKTMSSNENRKNNVKQDSLAVTVYKGTYQGKNLYFNNSFAPNGVGFSIKEIVASGSSANFVFNNVDASAFELDLKPLNLKIGDAVNVEVKHLIGSTCKLLNPEAILIKTEYKPNTQTSKSQSFPNAQTSDTTQVYAGIYKGKNLYFNNPFGPGGQGFCVKEILVNGKKSKSDMNFSAFELDLKQLKLNQGAALKVEVIHESGCTPRLLNREAIQ